MSIFRKKKKDLSHIAKCYDLIETNKGVGLVFDKIENFDGTKSITFEESVLRKELTDKQENHILNELKGYIFKNSLLCADVSLGNILLQKISEIDYKLVIVDGLGARKRGWKFLIQCSISFMRTAKIKKQWDKLIRNYYNIKKYIF